MKKSKELKYTRSWPVGPEQANDLRCLSRMTQMFTLSVLMKGTSQHPYNLKCIIGHLSLSLSLSRASFTQHSHTTLLIVSLDSSRPLEPLEATVKWPSCNSRKCSQVHLQRQKVRDKVILFKASQAVWMRNLGMQNKSLPRYS